MKLNEMSKAPTARQMNKLMESRFGFSIDYKQMSFKKAYTMAKALGEGLETIKRTHGIHTAEKHPKYMEMLMVREGLHRWLIENKQQLTESEMAKSQAILAAKDMVDSIQDMLEKISKMQNEQLPALLDTIRDQIGIEKADGFKGAVAPLLGTLAQTLQQGRETADQAARGLAGEEMTQPMDMGAEMGAEMGDEMGDEFSATGAAVGGPDSLGRERR